MRTDFVKVADVSDADAIRSIIPAAIDWLSMRTDVRRCRRAAWATARPPNGSPQLIEAGAGDGLREHLIYFAIRVGARRLSDTADCLLLAGYDEAAAIAADAGPAGRLDAAPDGDQGLRRPAAAALRELAPTYDRLRAALDCDRRRADRVVRPPGPQAARSGRLRGVADGLVEDLQAEGQLVPGRGQRRRDPEDAAHAGQLHHVHVQAELQAAPGDRRAQRVRALLGLPVDDELEALQQPAAADVADRPCVPVLRAASRPSRRYAPSSAGPLVELRRAAARRARCCRPRRRSGSDTCVVKNRKPRSWARCSISALVTTAASGSPAPSVLDRVRMSGTTPSRWNAYQVAGAAQPGLRLVEDQQHAALAALVAQRGEVARRRLDARRRS